MELDEELTTGLKELSQRCGATLFMTVLAGWAALLARLSNQSEVVIGTPTANRTRTEVEGLIGFFVNTLALRVDLSGSPNSVELLKRVKRLALDAQANREIPFEQVVELVRPERSVSHSPIFQVMLGWQNLPGQELVDLPPPPGLQIDPVGPATQSAQFDLALSLREVGGRVVGSVVYASALFERETIRRYLQYWKQLLEGMVADERRAVGELEILSAAERARILKHWNNTEAEYPPDRCVQGLFEEQVERTPSCDCGSVRRSDAAAMRS